VGLTGSEPHALAGATLKLQRAYFHCQALNDAIQRVRRDYPNTPAVGVQELDAQARQMVFAIKLDPPPTTWATLIGDALHNLRSSLDHLFWELIRRRNYGHDLPPGTRATFPIFKNRGRFWKKGKDGDWSSRSGARSLLQIPADARRLILDVQPYKDGNGPELWRLHRLANDDKHQTLHYGVQAIVQAAYGVIAQQNVRLGAFTPASGILPPGGRVIATLEFTETGENAYIEVEPEFGFVEAFAEGGPAGGEAISETLGEILEYVTNEVFAERFWPYFGVEPSAEIRAITDGSKP
jgi:hypothetical protein